MRKPYIIILSFAAILLAGFAPAKAQREPIDLYFFYGDGCPHCAKEEKFLDKMEEKYDIEIHRFETWHDRENAKLMERVGREMGLDVRGVPLLIIGNRTVEGYYNDQTTGKQIEEIIKSYSSAGCEDIVGHIIDENKEPACIHGCEKGDEACLHECGCEADTDKADNRVLSVPFLGNIDPRNFSLPLLTFLIAGTDGFNPCAMWVLLFLISLLLGMQDRRRMWILGGSFIAASGAVYFLFLAAWLNIILFYSFIAWIRIGIGLVAVGSGIYHLYDAYKNRDGGCHVTDGEKRRKIFSRLRSLVAEKNFFLAVIGIILLAIAVNLVELVCSAGLPAVYAQILALSDLSTWGYYGYLLFYIFIFMLDDLLVFFLAMKTLELKPISSKYTSWARWVGGAIILVLGVLLIFKPGWIMFG